MSDTNQDTIKRMFEAGVHYGYSRSSRHPSAVPFVYGTKDGIEIIDLEKTAQLLQAAKEFVAKLAAEKKQVLFISSKPEARESIREAAEKINQPFVAGRWIGGTFTNFEQMKKRINKLEELKNSRDRGELGKYTKKEQLLIDREIIDLEARFGGIIDMKSLPGAIFVVDPKEEKIAVAEAIRKNIPIIAVLNTDNSADEINYPIYANDGARTSIRLFVEEIADAYQEGTKRRD